jgi:hypothetical protein
MLVLIFFVFFMAGCAGNPKADAPAPMVVTEPVQWSGDVDLAPVLVRPQLNQLELQASERVEMRIGALEFRERLGDIVEDTTAPWLVRLNAIKLLANRGATAELPVFASALRSRDERVRVGAVTAMREYMSILPSAATDILVYALKDPSPRVQTAALQMIGDRAVDTLRAFANRTKDREVRAIALDLIRAAEERGAPLAAKDSSGTLERVTSNGTTLTFHPTVRWQKWDAAVGQVSVALPGKKPVVIATGVEAVGNVVPAYFDSDGKNLVYELNREIHVRDLVSNADRKLADGIAPRMLPFTNDVIYFTEVRSKRSEMPNSFGMKYNVMRVPLAGGTPVSVGQVSARALNEVRGNYSNIRWSRVQEQEGSFFLVGDMIDPFPLPNPFGN